MDIIFSRRNIRILRYIRHHPKATVDKIQRRFSEDVASVNLLYNFCVAGYLVRLDADGETIPPESPRGHYTDGTETFRLTDKGYKILDDRFDRLWQWSIPVLVSVFALGISIFGLFK